MKVRRLIIVVLALGHAATLLGHDLERTQARLTFARDGSFVLDIANDPSWLTLRMASVRGPFADRIVLFADGHEIRPASVELLHDGALDVHRVRGSMPRDARLLRFYYGLVIDPYPLTVRHADGRIQTEVIAGDAWSREIDLRGEFRQPARWPIIVVLVLVAAGLVTRTRAWLPKPATKARR
jgi:hypothetical protein